MSDLMHPSEPPRVGLALLPTPLVELKNFPSAAGIGAMWVKRDDLTGLEITGNKIRKLEYLLADAMAGGCDTIVTHGGYQSNHCRATAAACARLGLRCRLVLRMPDDAPADAATRPDGNLFLDGLLGAEISFHSAAAYSGNKQALIDAAMEAQRSAGRRPYFFPVGASVPLGCWGYARCMYELAQQTAAGERLRVYVPASSSGTVAGAIFGRALLGLRRMDVLGVPVSDSVAFFERDLRELLDATVARFGLPLTPEHLPIRLVDGAIGGGYAVPTAEGMAMLRLMARTEGMLLDPTYTSKALAGTVAHLRASPPAAGERVVFVHTGGVFGLMARRDLFWA